MSQHRHQHHDPDQPLPPTHFASDQQLEALVAGFESCRLEGGFSHHQHIAVACWYLLQESPDQALTHMREGLHRLLSHHGQSEAQIAAAYNETITAFWIKLLAHLLEHDNARNPAYQRANTILEGWGTMDPVFAHYSSEIVMSEEAKRGWVEPDLRPMPRRRE